MTQISQRGERQSEREPVYDPKDSVPPLELSRPISPVEREASARLVIDMRLDQALERVMNARADHGESSPEYKLALSQVQILEHARTYTDRELPEDVKEACVKNGPRWADYKPAMFSTYFALVAAVVAATPFWKLGLRMLVELDDLPSRITAHLL